MAWYQQKKHSCVRTLVNRVIWVCGEGEGAAGAAGGAGGVAGGNAGRREKSVKGENRDTTNENE